MLISRLIATSVLVAATGISGIAGAASARASAPSFCGELGGDWDGQYCHTSVTSERNAVRDSVAIAVHAAEERSLRQALDNFLGELKVEQRHYTRENRLLLHNRKSVVLQERMCFRNLPLSDWIEHEIPLDDGMDVERLVQDMTVFDKAVVNIADIPRPQRKALA